jgi:hypothetical protein
MSVCLLLLLFGPISWDADLCSGNNAQQQLQTHFKQTFSISCNYLARRARPISTHIINVSIGVAHECYASPLNQFLPSYGSAFPGTHSFIRPLFNISGDLLLLLSSSLIDTDRWFGSQGSFFDMRRIEVYCHVHDPSC